LFVVPWAAENPVRVGVDQSGRQHSTPAVDFAGRWELAAQVGKRSDARNPFSLDSDSGIRQNAGVGKLRPASRPRWPGACHDLRRIGEDD